MGGYRLRVTLLTLGVVLGYGSAAAHLYRHGLHAPFGHCHHAERTAHERAAPGWR